MNALKWVGALARRHPRYAAGSLAGALALSGLVCLGVVTAMQHQAPEAEITGVPTHSGVNADATTGPVLTMARSLPTSVTIPSISVQSRLLSLGQLPDGSVQVPLPGPDYSVAGWYRYSPTPGSMGPAVIVGHVDSAADGPSVFFRLASLRPGAVVLVGRADGTVAHFQVDSIGRYAKTQFPTKLVYGNTSFAGLRLITCGGPFDRATGHYLDNIVVFAHLVPAG